MATILVSYVGKQDPFSPKTKEEGSIVTLVKHLVKLTEIKAVILLHTKGTVDEAELTKDWLTEESLTDNTHLIPVNEKLSNDPVNLLVAIQEAKRALTIAENFSQPGDKLAFNASSGTPVMKTAWSVLQAAGYCANSDVWQVRNPHKITGKQEQVFKTNVDTLKQEFDFQVISKQIDNYNYNGALLSLENSSLFTDELQALLIYGKQRLAFNFNQAFAAIEKCQTLNEAEFLKQDISSLRQNKPEALLKEVYFKARIELKQGQYSDFLILLFAFQENLLHYLIKRKFLDKTEWSRNWKNVEAKILKCIKDDNQLFNSLSNKYRNLDYLNRPIMIEVLNYDQEFNQLLKLIDFIGQYARERNNYIHQLKGVDKIENSEQLTAKMRTILKIITKLPKENPFDSLNEIILNRLQSQLTIKT